MGKPETTCLGAGRDWLFPPLQWSPLPHLLLDVDLGQLLQAGCVLRNGCKTTLAAEAVCAFPRDCSIVY